VIDAPAIDAPIDAASTVQLIPDCTGIPNPDVTVSAASGSYMPQNPTLQVNQVLRFEPGDPFHDMTANNGEFATPLGQIARLRFTAAGSFPVRCSVHGFTGTITVN
jgi:plastocyanin